MSIYRFWVGLHDGSANCFKPCIIRIIGQQIYSLRTAGTPGCTAFKPATVMHIRPRRLRTGTSIRSMATEHTLGASNLIAPIFIVEGSNVQEEIPSMPNYFRYSLDLAVEEAKTLFTLGVPAGTAVYQGRTTRSKINKGTEGCKSGRVDATQYPGYQGRCSGNL